MPPKKNYANKIFEKVLQNREEASKKRAEEKKKLSEEEQKKIKEDEQRQQELIKKWTEEELVRRKREEDHKREEVENSMLPMWSASRPTQSQVNVNDDNPLYRHAYTTAQLQQLRFWLNTLLEELTKEQAIELEELEAEIGAPWECEILLWKKWVLAFSRLAFAFRIQLSLIVQVVYSDEDQLAYQVRDTYEMLEEQVNESVNG